MAVVEAPVSPGLGLGWPVVLGFLAAIVGPVLVFLASRRKTDVDETGLVLAEWKNLIAAHQATTASLRAEIEGLRNRLGSAEDRIAHLEDVNRGLLSENEGLRRQLAQASQSTAVMLRPMVKEGAPTSSARFAPEDADMIRRLDQAGHNSGDEA